MRKFFDVELNLNLKKLTGKIRFTAESDPPYQALVPKDDVWGDMVVRKGIQPTETKAVGPWKSFFISIAAGLVVAGAMYAFGL